MIDPRFQEQFANYALESDAPINEIIQRIKELKEAEEEMRLRQRQGDEAARIPGSDRESYVNPTGADDVPSFYEAQRSLQSPPPYNKGGLRGFLQAVIPSALAGLAAGATTPQGKGQGGHWSALGRGIAAGQARRDYERQVEEATEATRQRRAVDLYRTMMQGSTGPLARERYKRANRYTDFNLLSEMAKRDPNGPWASFAPYVLFGGSVGSPPNEADWARVKESEKRTAESQKRTVFLANEDKRKQDQWIDDKRENDGKAISKAMRDMIAAYTAENHGTGPEALPDLEELIRRADQPAVIDQTRPGLVEWILYNPKAMLMFETFLAPVTPAAREQLLRSWREYAQQRGRTLDTRDPNAMRETVVVPSVEQVVADFQAKNPGATREEILAEPAVQAAIARVKKAPAPSQQPQATRSPTQASTPVPTQTPRPPMYQPSPLPTERTPRPTLTPTPTNTPGPSPTPTPSTLDRVVAQVMSEFPGMPRQQAEQIAIARMRGF